MSSNYDREDANKTGARDDAAEAVRQAFAALPLEKKLSTLVRVELDLLGDIADGVASAVSKAGDEMSRAFNTARSSASGEPKPGGTTA
jgi:hypothetical protein